MRRAHGSRASRKAPKTLHLSQCDSMDAVSTEIQPRLRMVSQNVRLEGNPFADVQSNAASEGTGFPYLEASYLPSTSPNRTLPAIGSLMRPLFGWLKAPNMCTDHSLWYIGLVVELS